MSETGATAEQLHEAIQRKLEAWGVPAEQRNDEWSDYWLASDQVNNVAPVLVPPGYQIVPAGSVVLTADEAATAREAVRVAEETAEGNVLRAIAVGRPDERDKAQRFEEAYRALAAKLGGGA
jgi:hypothetical protein